jgi:hypothetical protein
VPSEIDSVVHRGFIGPLIATGRIPSLQEVAGSLGMPIDSVREALRNLAENHGVVLHPHICEPWIIHPFSASPSATWVESGERGWWVPCMWCACGVATLVGGNATIHTRIAGEAEDIDIHIEDGLVREVGLWVHFAVPPRAAWDNVHHFCATILPFRERDEVPRWSRRHGLPLGSVVPVSQVMDLGREWYGRYDDPEWRKWTVREAIGIFRKVGLTGEFWDVPVIEGAF